MTSSSLRQQVLAALKAPQGSEAFEERLDLIESLVFCSPSKELMLRAAAELLATIRGGEE